MSDYDFTSLDEVHSRAPMPSPCPLCAAKNQIIRLEAENAALREAIAAVEAACEDTTADSYDVNGKEWTDGYEAMLGVVRAALAIAQTDERKAETE